MPISQLSPNSSYDEALQNRVAPQNKSSRESKSGNPVHPRLKVQNMPGLVEEIESDFSSALGHLNQKSRTQVKANDTFLDLAILISLYYLELDIICRVNYDLRPRKKLIRDNEDEVWDALENN